MARPDVSRGGKCLFDDSNEPAEVDAVWFMLDGIADFYIRACFSDDVVIGHTFRVKQNPIGFFDYTP